MYVCHPHGISKYIRKTAWVEPHQFDLNENDKKRIRVIGQNGRFFIRIIIEFDSATHKINLCHEI